MYNSLLMFTLNDKQLAEYVRIAKDDFDLILTPAEAQENAARRPHLAEVLSRPLPAKNTESKGFERREFLYSNPLPRTRAST